MTTNMPWGAFRSDKIAGDRFGAQTVNAVLLSGHLSAGEAMDAANALRRSDHTAAFRYWVADAQFPVEETRAQ